MIIAGTGHRPDKLGGYDIRGNEVYTVIKGLIDQALEFLQPTLVLSGMALGFDQWLAESCLSHGIPFKACVPFRGFNTPWPVASKRHYDWLIQRASDTVYVTEGEGIAYHPSLLHRRNEYMVDNADRILACWNGTTGGTAGCLAYAARLRKPIDFLNVPAETWQRAREAELVIAQRRRDRRALSQLMPQQSIWQGAPEQPATPSPLPPAVQKAAPQHSDANKLSFNVGRKIDLDD